MSFQPVVSVNDCDIFLSIFYIYVPPLFPETTMRDITSLLLFTNIEGNDSSLVRWASLSIDPGIPCGLVSDIAVTATSGLSQGAMSGW